MTKKLNLGAKKRAKTTKKTRKPLDPKTLTIEDAEPTPEPTTQPQEATENPTPTPEPTPEPTMKVIAASGGDTIPDFDAAPIPEDELPESEAEPTEPYSGPETPPGLITYEIFRDSVGGGIKLTGQVTQLQTLIGACDESSWPEASRAMYDTILETPSLHWLIKPGAVWMQRTIAIGSWAVPVMVGCGREMKARKVAKAQQQEQQEQEADNAD